MPCSYSSLVCYYGSGGVGVTGWSGCKGFNSAGACGIWHEECDSRDALQCTAAPSPLALPTHCESRGRRRPARHRGQYCFPCHYCRLWHPSNDYTVGRYLLCAHLRQSLTWVWTAGRRHWAQTRFSLRSGLECHQLIPVWLGSHVCLVIIFPPYAGCRYGPPAELCASPGHAGVSRSRAWYSSGRVYHALGARLDTRTVAGWSVRSTLGLASRILFSCAAGPHRRYPDGILGATAGGCASRTAFR